MSSLQIEDDISRLEERITLLEKQAEGKKPDVKIPWWELRFGAFKDSPEYEEASRLGREYRESLSVEDVEDSK